MTFWLDDLMTPEIGRLSYELANTETRASF
jgi:hypothetical protein